MTYLNGELEITGKVPIRTEASGSTGSNGKNRNHRQIDGFRRLFTVATIRFQVLYVFVVLAHERRRILHCGVAACPTAEWTAQQLREAFPWETGPRCDSQRYECHYGLAERMKPLARLKSVKLQGVQ
jgi:hypothetical protein